VNGWSYWLYEDLSLSDRFMANRLRGEIDDIE
jgi:hypothetical protein